MTRQTNYKLTLFDQASTVVAPEEPDTYRGPDKHIDLEVNNHTDPRTNTDDEIDLEVNSPRTVNM